MLEKFQGDPVEIDEEYAYWDRHWQEQAIVPVIANIIQDSVSCEGDQLRYNKSVSAGCAPNDRKRYEQDPAQRIVKSWWREKSRGNFAFVF